MGNTACCESATLQQQQNPAVNPRVSEHPSKQPLPLLSVEITKYLEKNKQILQKVSRADPIIQLKDQKYKGQLNAQKKPHGSGILYYQNGDIFVGHFVDGVAKGKGSYVWKNGNYYSGEVNATIANDSNAQCQINDIRFQGSVKNNQIHGFGKLLGKGYTYQGHFQKGKIHKGRLTWTEQVTVKLTLSENQLKKDQFYSYQGLFDQNQKFTNRGILKGPSGVYTGFFQNGLKNGYGVFQYTNKLRYEGNYKDDVKNGQGTIYSTENKIAYCGQFMNGLPHGKGWVPLPDGTQNHMEFQDGISVAISKVDVK